MTQPDIIGFTGVFILLMAYLLNLSGVFKEGSRWYVALNIIGAGIACAASVLINYWPFIILEGVWAIVSLIAFIKLFVKTT